MKARDNPFSTRKLLNIRYIPQSAGLEELLRDLQGQNYRGAIVGPEGSGKTTLLEDLAARLSKQFSVRWFLLRSDTPVPFLENILQNELICIDGADLIHRSTWKKLLEMKLQGLLVAAHTPTPLPTLIRCSTNVELLHTITARLIGETSDEVRELSEVLFVKHHGNIREVLRYLYDVWAQR